MRIVIDIPEELTTKDKFYTDDEMRTIVKSVQNGTPLSEPGEWLSFFGMGYTCKDCEYKVGVKENFCPNCGRKMIS